MAGTEEETIDVVETPTESDCRFEWDEDSNLYFHASTGFYHDPGAGWYYSSQDGLYYTFENGSYVLFTCNEGEESTDNQCTDYVSSEPIKDRPCVSVDSVGDRTENRCPPSEWIEETAIDFSFSGYSNSEENPGDSLTTFATSGYHGEGEWTREFVPNANELRDEFSDDDIPLIEKSWQAQYGQVVRSQDEALSDFQVVDIWDWEMVMETVKEKNVARLIGRLVRDSCKLHPSMPVGGGLLKTTSIRDVHLDLVRVSSGKVYRLRSPSTRYLVSLTTYDASDPTKDWGFPDLFVNLKNSSMISINQPSGPDISDVNMNDNSSTNAPVPSQIDNQKKLPYRDRAAERRVLHGAFSIGPGQKDSVNDIYPEESSSPYVDTEAAAAEALNLFAGDKSTARRIMKNMGWKDGEALGSSTKGILQPLQAVWAGSMPVLECEWYIKGLMVQNRMEIA